MIWTALLQGLWHGSLQTDSTSLDSNLRMFMPERACQIFCFKSLILQVKKVKPERLPECSDWVVEHHGKQVFLASSPVLLYFIKTLLCLVISIKTTWMIDHSHYLCINFPTVTGGRVLKFVPDSRFQFYLLGLCWQKRLVKKGHVSHFNTNKQESTTSSLSLAARILSSSLKSLKIGAHSNA